MKIHPQVFKTLQLIERLRARKQTHRLDIRFGKDGIIGARVDGKEFEDWLQSVPRGTLECSTKINLDGESKNP